MYMNKLIICKYVNATTISNSKFQKSLITSKHYTTQTELKRILDDAAKDLNITHLNDWYKMPTKSFPKLFGGSDQFEKEFNSSPAQLLSSAYPEHDWVPWKFDQCPSNFWSDTNNVRKYVNWAAKELSLKELSDWYNVTNADFIKVGGKYLLTLKSSLLNILTEVYPEYDWLPWKLKKSPKNYWNDMNNVRKFMNWAAKELSVKEMSDWYNVGATDLVKLGGGYLLQLKSSYRDLLMETYPEYNWEPWKFEQYNRHFWSDIKNVRKYMDWAGQQLGVKEMSDWYKVSRLDLSNYGAHYLLSLRPSLFDLLSDVYPEYDWVPWKFNSFSSKILVINPKRRESYVDWLSNQFNIKEMKDWYEIKAEQIIDLNGGILIAEYHSLPNLLVQMYSSHKWDNSKFKHNQANIWTDKHLANYFVDWLKTQDQREVALVCQYMKEIRPNGEEKDALTQALQSAFPKHFQKASSQNTKKSQYFLKECIESIFNKDNENALILEEYRHPDIVNLELDYFLPQYNIAFEYQGKQHYRTIGFHHRKESIETMRKRDREKLDSIKKSAITLIEVPYWWDRKVSSLAATIYNSRPDLFDTKPNGTPIPITSPQTDTIGNSANPSKQILMTATVWDNDTMEPKGWYMTEKYDGIRFYWDGTECYSRQGNKIKIPDTLAVKLPRVALDGELWTQYGLQQEPIGLMNTNSEEKWSKAIFWIFDAPKLNKPLEERIEFLQQLNLPSFAKVVEFVKCEGKEHLKQFNEAIIEKGGEGVILREPGSMYERGRSTGLRKHKPYFDTEVRVLKNKYPQGFTCEQLNGKTVFVNTENSEEAKAVKKGSVITVKHSGINVHGTLLYPQFFRERLDVTWKDLLNKVV